MAFFAADKICKFVTEEEEKWTLANAYQRGEFHADEDLLEATYWHLRYGESCRNSALSVVRGFIRCRLVQESEYDPGVDTRSLEEIIRARGQCPPTFDRYTEAFIRDLASRV